MAQDVEQVIHHRPAGPALNPGRITAIERIFPDIEIKCRQVVVAEMVQHGEDLMIVMAVNGLADRLVDIMQTRQHPAFEFRHIFNGNSLSICETVQTAEKIAECISQPPVVIHLTLDNLRPDTQIIVIIRIRHPDPQDIGTVLFDHILRRHRIAQRFGHFTALFIEDKAMGQHAVIWRPPLVPQLSSSDE